MINSLSHISISTKNLNKVEKFYINNLGFKKVHEFVNKKGKIYGFFLYAGNKTFIEFFYSKNKLNKLKLDTSLRHICFTTNNIYLLKKKLIKFDKKIKIIRGKTDNVIQFFTKDFENNIIEFHQYDKKSKFYSYFKK